MADYKHLLGRLTCDEIAHGPKRPGNPARASLWEQFLLLVLALLNLCFFYLTFQEHPVMAVANGLMACGFLTLLAAVSRRRMW